MRVKRTNIGCGKFPTKRFHISIPQVNNRLRIDCSSKRASRELEAIPASRNSKRKLPAILSSPRTELQRVTQAASLLSRDFKRLDTVSYFFTRGKVTLGNSIAFTTQHDGAPMQSPRPTYSDKNVQSSGPVIIHIVIIVTYRVLTQYS